MFKKIDKSKFPPRQWSLLGFPGAGKSTFAAQMHTPILPIDADHRFSEVAHFAAGDVYALSDNPADNVDAESIVKALKAGMKDSGVKTIVIDSLTSILSPLIVEAIMDNDAGRNKNRVAAFKSKSLAMRLIQDAITGWGVDTLWIYHLRSSLDGQAHAVEGTSISAVELARLRRSLNLQLRVVQDGEKRGVHIDWARRGRSGMTLWDDSGKWVGMPEKIEQAIYGGLTLEDMERIEEQTPTSFAGPEAAISWGFEQGAFRDALHAKNSYEKVKAEKHPKTSDEMWRLWLANVAEHKAEQAEAQPVAA